jgi:hypothetical protein
MPIASCGACYRSRPMEKIAALLIAAHAFGDFALQPDWLAARKRQLGYLLLHLSLHAVVVYLILQLWTCWQAPLFVFVLHGLIDSIKQRLPDSTKWFVFDQVAHFISLLALAWLLVHRGILPSFAGIGYKPLVFFGGLVLTIQGAGFLVGKFARRLIEENQLQLEGLINGGRWIGRFERALIFVLIFIDQPMGIGFLVAAKSILRFEEAKQQKFAEYVLIGTLLSFSLAIALASITKWAMSL